MKITNYTKLPNQKLRDIIRFVTPSGVTGYDITFKNNGRGALRGRAFPRGTNYHIRKNRRVPLIVISVPKTFGPIDRPIVPPNLGFNRSNPRRDLARERQKCRGYMPREVFTEHEAIVDIVAHELRHLWQCNVPRGRRVWGGRGQYSERDADAYGIRLTRAWRRA